MNTIRKQRLLAYVIAVFFVLVNLITLDWKIPWQDEVSYSDLAINYALDGTYITRAWFMELCGKAFPIYPPLHYFSLILWVKCFGASYYSINALNLVFVTAAFIVLNELMNKYKIPYFFVPTITFSLMFWGCAYFMQFYRTGRPDMIVLFFISLYLFLLDKYHYSQEKKKYVVGLAITILLTTVAGFQGTAFLLFISIVYLIYLRKRKETLQFVKIWITGGIGAFICLSIYFFLNGELKSFFIRPLAFSSTIMLIAQKLLPFINDAGIGSETLIEKLDTSEQVVFYEKLVKGYMASYAYLLAVLLLSGVVIQRIIAGTMKKKQWCLYVTVLLFPLYMVLVGRYPDYYAWMGYLYALLVLIFLLPLDVNKWTAIFPLFIAIHGIMYVFDFQKKSQYCEIREYVDSLNFKENDVVVAPFNLYYDLRKQTRETYMYGNYPIAELHLPCNYIIRNEEDTPRFLGYLKEYTEVLKTDGYDITKIKATESPKMTIYKVSKK